jgi:hypothetical protein
LQHGMKDAEKTLAVPVFQAAQIIGALRAFHCSHRLPLALVTTRAMGAVR